MIRNGVVQDLVLLRQTSDGWVLGDDDEDVALLPNGTDLKQYTEGDTVSVFVHRAADGRNMASTGTPKVQVGEFTTLQVIAIDQLGAHLEWGYKPDLLVPKAEQKKDMEEGRWYVVRIATDERTGRLYASSRVDHFLDNTTLSVQKGDTVQLLVHAKSPLGISVIVNNKHHGLVHANEVFKPVSIGDRVTGYVKTVREDNKLDITLQPIGYRQYIDVNTAMLAKRLQGRTGFLPLTDKSSAEEIHAEFGISKKAFKKALGALYKDRLVRMEEMGIIWVGPQR